MFERFTEKARRVVFFARYEASQYGSPEIDSEHLLLGLIREHKALYRWLPRTDFQTIRQRVDEHLPKHPSIPTTVDLPLSDGAKRVLKYAADEAEQLEHRHIGTEHLFLGLLDEQDCFAASLLREGGADAASIRLQVAASDERQSMPGIYEAIRTRSFGSLVGGAILIHGIARGADRIHESVQRCRIYNWHWAKRPWTNADIVIEKRPARFLLICASPRTPNISNSSRAAGRKTTASFAAGNYLNRRMTRTTARDTPTVITGYALNATQNSGSGGFLLISPLFRHHVKFRLRTV